MTSVKEILKALEIDATNPGGHGLKVLGSEPAKAVISPIDGAELASVTNVNENEFETILDEAHKAFFEWRKVPAPKRGELVKAIGEEVGRNHKALAELVTLEMGKPLREGMGEVQEMVDIFDFAVGQSRQLYGLTMPSERGEHRIQEQWHPLGLAAVITAFNFPVAVWAWNTALALIAGDTVLWKPSSKTPLTAIAVNKMAQRVLKAHGYSPAVCSLTVGAGSKIGDKITGDPRVALVSYTGSVPMGRKVGVAVQQRFGKHILELGGNNATIITPKANLDLALKAIYFGAVGTCGQRCTSTRRLIIHEDVYEKVVSSMKSMYEKTPIGDPREDKYIMGPMVDTGAVDTMMAAIESVKKQGGKVVIGGERLDMAGGCYVTPCMVEAGNDTPMVKEETFAPILYLMKYKTLEEAIAMQNDVPQGLSSSIITDDLREAELYLSCCGSDCGIANINAGTSGAEIGGAFGGEKETGGGRESGSDSWKAYMRRQTNVINYSGRTELAQGISLDF